MDGLTAVERHRIEVIASRAMDKAKADFWNEVGREFPNEWAEPVVPGKPHDLIDFSGLAFQNAAARFGQAS